MTSELKSELHSRLGQFAQELWEQRKQEDPKYWTRKRVAREAGDITETTLNNVEKGKLDIDTWAIVVSVLGGDPTALLQRAAAEIRERGILVAVGQEAADERAKWEPELIPGGKDRRKANRGRSRRAEEEGISWFSQRASNLLLRPLADTA